MSADRQHRPPRRSVAGDRGASAFRLVAVLCAALVCACGRAPEVRALGAGNVELGITFPPVDAGRSNRQLIILGSGPVSYVETRSQRAITVGFARLDHSTVTQRAGDYSLSSASDPTYHRPVAAIRVGSDRQAVGFDADRQEVVDDRLHLLFPRALQPGHEYELDISAAGAGGGAAAITLRYRPERISGSIQLNQVGYLPAARKFAFLGNWLGSAGPLPIDATGFDVIDLQSGTSVWRGNAVARAMNDPWSGNDVWEADFSEFTTPGRYRLRVPGLGVSDEFTIDETIYDALYRRVMRLFYHSRNSIPVVSPWADPEFQRIEGGVPAAMDGVFHAAVGTSPLGRGEPEGGYHPVSRGWFDAGDYGQYVPNAAPVWYQVGAAFDLAPERFRDGDLNIPESGNGIPDVLDELEWGFDWLLAMQDPVDGGVYFRISSRSWDETPPHEIDAPRLIAEKTTHATAAFAAACAIHARLIQPYRPERARHARQAALNAWEFLRQHPQWPAEGERYRNPTGVSAGEYADSSARDNLLWAAAELYRATFESRFLYFYESLAPSVPLDPTSGVSYKEQGMAAAWAYAMTPGEGRNPELAERARAALTAAADWYVRKARENPFRAPVHQHIGFVGWGSFARSTRATLPLLQAYRLTGDPVYLEWAWQTPHPQLGANPLALSFITGTGARSPRYPLSKLSRFAGGAAPLPGLPVHGPHFHLPALWQEMVAVNRSYLPPEESPPAQAGTPQEFAGIYPVLRRYTDSRYLPPMSEPTVAEYAEVAIAYALLLPKLFNSNAFCISKCENPVAECDSDMSNDRMSCGIDQR